MSGYDEIYRCNRCGFCQAVCPTYLHSRDEAQVARGRIHLTRLLLEGKYDFTKDAELAGKVDECLLCGACTVRCPSSVETVEVMVSARNDFTTNRGLSLFQKLVYRGLLSHSRRLMRVATLLRLYGRSGAGGVLYGGILRRAMERLIHYDSFLPRPLPEPARSLLGQIVRPTSTPVLKVAYFLGCASNVFWSTVVVPSVAYLVSRGVEVHLPPTNCCGEPHRSGGDPLEARKLARQNSALIFQNKYDFVVTDCSTCARALRRYDDFVGTDSQEGDRVRALLGQVTDLNTLVLEKLGLPKDKLKPIGFTQATYHDPCHAVRGLGISLAPRAILQAIPELELIEMEGADSCCGGAGSYGFTHPEMSAQIAATKAQNITRTGADLLATSCPACALQLGAGLKRAARPMTIHHPVELLAISTGAATLASDSTQIASREPQTS
jgi:glycolate oxidase iron-sulfur subunit